MIDLTRDQYTKLLVAELKEVDLETLNYGNHFPTKWIRRSCHMMLRLLHEIDKIDKGQGVYANNGVKLKGHDV